jgi:endonuclease YncB( thermonuclease family)
MRTISCVVLLLLAGLATADTSSRALAAETLTGKVVAVGDGDTLTLLDATKTQHKVRLHGIDAPESKQAFGNVARKALADLVFGNEVDVEVIEKDRYGREVGKVHVGGRYVNAEMVRQGLAWRYFQFDKENDFGGLEDDARKQRRGLWADAHPVAPWEWRKERKAVGAGR